MSHVAADETALLRSLTTNDLDGLLALYAELQPSDPPVARDRLESTFARMCATPSLVQLGFDRHEKQAFVGLRPS